MNSIKEKFIRNLIDFLNRENEYRICYNKNPLDICYMVSVVDQNIEDCKDFINDIKNKEWYINAYNEDHSNGYTNGEIEILILKPKEEQEDELTIENFEDYCYCIEFLFDERYWGYCECTPNDKGYNEKYKCCGVDCDWVAPAFRITKKIHLGYYSWAGYEKDYWKFKEQFEKNEKNKNKEIEEYKKQQRIKQIHKEIERLNKELNKLL